MIDQHQSHKESRTPWKSKRPKPNLKIIIEDSFKTIPVKKQVPAQAPKKHQVESKENRALLDVVRISEDPEEGLDIDLMSDFYEIFDSKKYRLDLGDDNVEPENSDDSLLPPEGETSSDYELASLTDESVEQQYGSGVANMKHANLIEKVRSLNEKVRSTGNGLSGN